MVAPRWRSVTLPVATTFFAWSPSRRSASRNFALSRSGLDGARRSCFSSLSRSPSASSPARENSAAFVSVAGLLRSAGLNAPEIHEHDLGQGFLLVTDLGTKPYLAALGEETADQLFGDATSALVRWQAASRADVLPDYD